jgi:hypothetical protein
MDHRHFDDLLRDAAYTPSTRRTVALLLAGSALGGLAARLGLTDVTEAKPKKAKARHKGTPEAERKGHGQLQAEGKRKGKKHHKSPKTPPPPPPDPICDSGRARCPDGSCPPIGECCPGSRPCDDGFCHKEDQCCPNEKPCDGGCIPDDACCPDDPWPLCNRCDQVVCENGAYVCKADHTCPQGGEWNPEHCRCDYCEEDCGDPYNDLCHAPRCQDGERCIYGACQLACGGARPQLCCVQDPYSLEVRCYCMAADQICFNCGYGNVCACTPGDAQVCCDPNNPLHRNCPEACHCPGR